MLRKAYFCALKKIKMNKISPVLSILALIGVIVLFVMRASAPTPEVKEVSAGERVKKMEDEMDSRNLRIMHVRLDTLLSKYEGHKADVARLESKARSIDADLARKAKVFEENYRVLEEEARNLSQDQLRMAQADLMQKEEEILRYREMKKQELLMEETQITGKFRKLLDDVIQEIKDEFEVDYIMLYDLQSPILHANPSFDITDIVLEKLNSKTEEMKKGADKK